MYAAEGERILFSGHPSWRSMLSFHAKGLLGAVVAGVVAGLATAAATGSVRAGWVIAAVLVVFAATLSAGMIRCRRVTYTISTRRLSIETGLMARDVHETRLERIQNVTVTQSLLDRALGIGTIAFDTAGGAGFDFSFRGVSEPHRITAVVDRAVGRRAMEPAGEWASPG